MATISEEQKWLLRQYPTYSKNSKAWKFFDVTYFGGVDYHTSENLHPLSTELLESSLGDVADSQTSQGKLVTMFGDTAPRYDKRIQEAFRANRARALIDVPVGYVESQPPQRNTESLPDGVKRFIARCNRARNQTLTEFSVDSLRQLLIRGILITVVDTKLSEEMLDGKKIPSSRRANGALEMPEDAAQDPDFIPFTYTLHPSDIKFPRFDPDSNLEEVIIREYHDVAEFSNKKKTLKDGAGDIVEVFRYWNRDIWELWIREDFDKDEEEGAAISSPGQPIGVTTEQFGVTARAPGLSNEPSYIKVASGPNTLGFIPIRIIYLERTQDPMFGAGLLQDNAGLERAIYNLENVLYYYLREAADVQVVYFTDMAPEGDDEERDEQGKTLRLLAKAPIVFMDSESKKPEVVKKEAQNLGLLLEAIRMMTNQMYINAGLKTRVQEAAQASGLAKLRDFQELNASIAKFAGKIEENEEWQVRTASKILDSDLDVTNPLRVTLNSDGREEKSGNIVAYPNNFDIRSLDTDMALLRVLPGVAGIEPLRFVLRRMLESKYPDRMEDQDFKSVLSAIDGMEAEDILTPGGSAPPKLGSGENPLENIGGETTSARDEEKKAEEKTSDGEE